MVVAFTDMKNAGGKGGQLYHSGLVEFRASVTSAWRNPSMVLGERLGWQSNCGCQSTVDLWHL